MKIEPSDDGKRAVTKRYLGDGVYVDLDERGFVLTTEYGEGATNTIVLEPEVWAALTRYATDYEQ